MLCEAMKLVQENLDVDECSIELQDWWKQHQVHDATKSTIEHQEIQKSLNHIPIDNFQVIDQVLYKKDGLGLTYLSIQYGSKRKCLVVDGAHNMIIKSLADLNIYGVYDYSEQALRFINKTLNIKE